MVVFDQGAANLDILYRWIVLTVRYISEARHMLRV